MYRKLYWSTLTLFAKGISRLYQKQLGFGHPVGSHLLRYYGMMGQLLMVKMESDQEITHLQRTTIFEHYIYMYMYIYHLNVSFLQPGQGKSHVC